MTLTIYTDTAGEHRWRLVAANGRIVADSAEGYATASNARRAWRRLEAIITGGGVEVAS